MTDCRKIWECFINDTVFNEKHIKQDILNSWRRCKKYGVTLYDFDENLLMKPDEKERYVLKYLPEYNEPRYREFCDIVEKLNINISVYDHNAKLRYIVNYDDAFDSLYPKLGYFLDAAEDSIGTNSTCLAILENKPFMVIGPDHYKYIFHEFSCAAAPFYSDDNTIAGTINASFMNTSVNSDTLNIIYSLARLYETLILEKAVSAKKMTSQTSKGSRQQEFYTFERILGESEAIDRAKGLAKKAAKVDTTILIYGESGSGKEMFAQAIHSESKRCNGPFVAINCGAIPKELIESELFGYEAGAFTGASKEGKQGLLEYASGGTLFLDEIENMPFSAQVKILRALSSSSITRIGGNRPVPIDIRVIAASKRDLKEEIEKGNFREDLYYRINVIQLDIPPLRARKQDIRQIFEHFIKTFSEKTGISITSIDDKFIEYLEAYHWPGNVRELINIIERSLVLSDNGDVDDSLLPSAIKESYIAAKLKNDFNKVFEEKLPEGKCLLQIAEEIVIRRIYTEENCNVAKAAKRLGISRPTLYKKLKDLDT